MTARFVFRRAYAPFHLGEAEQARRFPTPDAHRESFHWRLAPTERRKLWKWPARCGLQLFAHAKNVRHIGAEVKCFESIRQQRAPSACSRCEKSDTPHIVRHVPKSKSVRRRKQGAREGNRRQEKRWQCCLPAFRDSDWRSLPSMTQPWPTAEILALQLHARATLCKYTRLRFACSPERLRFAEAPEYSICLSTSGWPVFQPSTKPSHRFLPQSAA